jgi:flavin reductase ActVB
MAESERAGEVGDARDAREVVDRLYDAYNRHALGEAAALYGADGAHEDVAGGRHSVGPEAVRDGLGRFIAAFPDARWEVVQVVAAGPRATATYRLSGTLRSSLGPFVADGQRLDLRGVLALELDEGGLIRRTVDYWDGAAFARQMGDLPGLASGVSPDGFRRAMRLLAGGVAVVTTVVEGRPWGLTISACCSLTADPPRMLISLDSRTASCQAIVKRGAFGVALLGSDQVEVARVCSAAGQPKFIDDLIDEELTDDRQPVIRGALSHLSCTVAATHRVGDHRLIVGRVLDVLSPRSEETGEPLVYFERAFRTVGEAIS